MSQQRSEEVYLEDILTAAEDAMSFTAGMSYEEFLEDKKTVFAVIRALEIIGEATKRISEDFKVRNPSLPWRTMAGMRDRLIHDYPKVDLSTVWGAVTQDLPKTIPQLRRLLSQTQD
jgi:uncharacterized protein with HEPN domain